jgi:hypothetical protein
LANPTAVPPNGIVIEFDVIPFPQDEPCLAGMNDLIFYRRHQFIYLGGILGVDMFEGCNGALWPRHRHQFSRFF